MRSWNRGLAGCVIVVGVAFVGMSGVAGLSGCRPNFDNIFVDSTDFLITGRTLSFFSAVQVDPQSEDSAGPQFVVVDDLNGDGLPDLVSAWNQSQPVQIHLQGRSDRGEITFETTILAGDIPVVSVAGLGVADFDQDGVMDIAVLVKQSSLAGATCLDAEAPAGGLSGLIITYLGPNDVSQMNQALAWREVPVGASQLQGNGDADSGPEFGGFTALQVADMDLDTDLDMVVAWNSDCDGGTAAAVIFQNQGPSAVRDGTWIGSAIPDDAPKGTIIRDVAVGDIDRDGDLDVVATHPEATSLNVRWFRNPAADEPDDYHISDGKWQVGTVGQVATAGDVLRIADIDQDGVLDVLTRSTNGKVIQWLRGPEGPTTAPVRSIPWQVYTLAEFTERTPQGLAIGDLNGDGRLEVVAAADGGIAWFDSKAAPTVYDQWIENLIVDDISDDAGDAVPATTDPNVEPVEIQGPTLIQTVLVADLDGNGTNDIIATLDRNGLSGLSNDALVWFRNTRRP